MAKKTPKFKYFLDHPQIKRNKSPGNWGESSVKGNPAEENRSGKGDLAPTEGLNRLANTNAVTANKDDANKAKVGNRSGGSFMDNLKKSF